MEIERNARLRTLIATSQAQPKMARLDARATLEAELIKGIGSSELHTVGVQLAGLSTFWANEAWIAAHVEPDLGTCGEAISFWIHYQRLLRRAQTVHFQRQGRFGFFPSVEELMQTHVAALWLNVQGDLKRSASEISGLLCNQDWIDSYLAHSEYIGFCARLSAVLGCSIEFKLVPSPAVDDLYLPLPTQLDSRATIAVSTISGVLEERIRRSFEIRVNGNDDQSFWYSGLFSSLMPLELCCYYRWLSKSGRLVADQDDPLLSWFDQLTYQPLTDSSETIMASDRFLDLFESAVVSG